MSVLVPRPIPSLDSISLINFFDLSSEFVKKLSYLKVRNISLTPSHFGITKPNNTQSRSREVLKSLIKHGIRSSSIQGVLYGISHDVDFVRNVSNRLKFLDQLASEFEIPYLILGSADLRKNPDLWMEALEIIVKCQNLMENEILIENICIAPCQIEFDPFYFVNCKLNVCYDISNHMACEFHSKQDLIIRNEIKYMHLSSHSHTAPKSFSDLMNLNVYLQSSPINIESIWEISDICQFNEISEVEFKNLSNLIISYNNKFIAE